MFALLLECHREKFLPRTKPELLFFQFLATISDPLTMHHCKQPGSTFSVTSLRLLERWDLVFPLHDRQRELSWPLLTVQVLQSHHHQTCSNLSVSFLHWGTQEWTSYSRGGLRTAEQKAVASFPSHNPLVMLLSIQHANISLAFCHSFVMSYRDRSHLTSIFPFPPFLQSSYSTLGHEVSRPYAFPLLVFNVAL